MQRIAKKEIAKIKIGLSIFNYCHNMSWWVDFYDKRWWPLDASIGFVLYCSVSSPQCIGRRELLESTVCSFSCHSNNSFGISWIFNEHNDLHQSTHLKFDSCRVLWILTLLTELQCIIMAHFCRRGVESHLCYDAVKCSLHPTLKFLSVHTPILGIPTCTHTHPRFTTDTDT